MLKRIITKQNVLIILLYNLMLIITLVLMTPDYKNWLAIFGLLLSLFIVFSIVAMHKAGIKFVSFSALFLILLFLFHFGQVPLSIFNYDFKEGANFLAYFSNDLVKKSLIISFAIFSATLLGVLIRKMSLFDAQNKENFVAKSDLFLNLKIRYISIAILLLSLPVKIKLDIQNFQIAQSADYFEVLESLTQVSGVEYSLNLISYTGLAMLILSFSHKPATMKFLIIVSGAYELINMVSGGRGIEMIFLLLLFYIYHKRVSKITWKNMLWIFIFGYFIVAFLTTLANTRNFGFQGWNILFSTFLLNLKENPLLDFLAEIGGTIQTPIRIIGKVPDDISYGYGVSIIGGFIQALPNIGGLLNGVLEKTNFMSQIGGSGIGGSYIGELYYNFGPISVLVAVLFGFIIQDISNKMDEIIDSDNLVKFGYYVPIFIMGLWWVRNYFSGIVRISVWNAVLIIVIHLFINLLTNKFRTRPKVNHL